MIRFEIQLQNKPIGTVTVTDIAHNRVKELRENYFSDEFAADSVQLKASVNVHSSIYANIRIKGNYRVDRPVLDVSKDEVVFLMTFNGMRISYDVTKMFA